MTSMGETKMLYAMLRRMALQSWVSPVQLIPEPGSPARLAEIFGQLHTFCTIGTGNYAGLWRLNDDARRRVFQSWKREDLVDELRAVPTNAVKASVSLALGLSQDDSEALPSNELIDLRAALTWLPERLRGTATPDEVTLTQQIERTSLQEDVNMLCGRQLIGRKIQLARLNALLAEATPDTAAKIVNVWGSGGIGKSSLLAAFQRQLEERKGIIVLRIDFDRPDLNPLEPTSLDREIIRQIGRAVPDLWTECNQTIHGMLEFAAASARKLMAKRFSSGSGRSFSQLHGRRNQDSELTNFEESDMESADTAQRSELLNILEQVRDKAEFVVLLIDTFERVEAGGASAVRPVVYWIERILKSVFLPSLAVIAGRNDIASAHHVLQGRRVNMPLNQLTRADAIRLLKQLGCTPGLASLLVQHLPTRSPLVLRLASDAFKNRAEESTTMFAQLKNGVIPDGLLSAYLYTRILDHLPDATLRQYALASLALPELDQGVLKAVLMPELEPDIVEPSHVTELFDALANVHWLIERTSDKLRLRTDLRDLVLQVVSGDSAARQMHRRVRTNALDYHLSRTGAWHSAMVLYYKIVQAQERGEPDDALARFADPLRKYAGELFPFATDLPPSLRLALSERQGNQIDLDAAVSLLSTEEWRRMMDGGDGRSGRGQEIVSREDPLIAHRLYVGRPTARGALPPAYALHAACDSARWDELQFDLDAACDELFANVADSDRWSPHLMHLAALVRHSLFSMPNHSPPALVQLMEQIVPRCAAYGAATSVADTFSLAEVFHSRSYLSNKLLEKIGSGPKTDRVLLIHAQNLRLNALARLSGAAVVRFDKPETSASVIMDGSSTAAIETLVDLGGRRWSAYQRFYRDLGRSSVVPEFVQHARFHLPEFYRPLRQAMLEAFAADSKAFRVFRADIGEFLSLGPSEFAPKRFDVLADSDPHTWLHALVQYADWCGALLEVAKAAGKASGKSARLREVIGLLEVWISVLKNLHNKRVLSIEIG